MATFYHFPFQYLKDFSQQVFMHFGISAQQAEIAAEVLSASDLRGIDSHGVARLHTYFEMLSIGRINPKPNMQVVREKYSAVTVDGDSGLGLVVGPWANEVAMERAEKYGTGWVAVRNSNHYGIAGYYVLKALERDLIGWSMTNSAKLVAPLWGGERMLGTNPISVGFPGLEEPPIVLDMATSAVAYGKIQIAQRKGESVPDGWIVDKDGNMSNVPADMVNGGALLPLGSTREMGGHKGYGLSIMVDVLCGALGGANWGPWVPPFALRQFVPEKEVGKGTGHFFGAMAVDAFIEKDEFKRQIDDYIRTFRKTKPAPGQTEVLLPGDPEREAEAIRKVEGIPVVEAVVNDLLNVSKETGIPFEVAKAV